MDNREYFIHRWTIEQPKFGKVIRAIPEGQLDYKPHERSKSAGDLAWQLAEEQRILIGLLDRGEIHFDERQRPDTVEEIAKAYESATAELGERLKTIDETKWTSEAKFFFGDKVGGTNSVMEYMWGFLVDLIHHRGQLTVYLRPMGGKVPAIYGPSADDPGR
ncbi:MAG: hypothetical protein QOH21_3203 [Acidobacteriota bacterium]|jgi:uncharacterized damage-inducible protein DinB|nr:hypothetical protein [Acidobacteriota bacterium]